MMLFSEIVILPDAISKTRTAPCETCLNSSERNASNSFTLMVSDLELYSSQLYSMSSNDLPYFLASLLYNSRALCCLDVILYIRDLIKLIKPVKSNLVILNLSYDFYTRFKK